MPDFIIALLPFMRVMNAISIILIPALAVYLWRRGRKGVATVWMLWWFCPLGSTILNILIYMKVLGAG